MIEACGLTKYYGSQPAIRNVNFRVEKRYSKGLAVLVNYTIQKNLESGGAGPDAYSQNGGTSIALDTYNIARERGVAPIDIPLGVVVSDSLLLGDVVLIVYRTGALCLR